MKRYIHLLSGSIFLLVFATSCKKNINQVVFNGGTAPVLSSTVTGTVTLSALSKNDEAFTLSWTNPDYSFSTGANSHDVSYNVQLDTSGANFGSSVKQEFSVSRDLSYSMSVGLLNNYLTKMNLEPDLPHELEIRVVSNLNGTVPLTSNVLKFSGVIPYEDFAVQPPGTGELYITGDATNDGWTNNPSAGQKFTKMSKGEFYIIMNFVPGKYYKFLSDLNKWQPQYGGTSATGGDIGVNLGNSSDPSAIPTPDVAGSYKVDVNFKTGKYSVTKQ